MNGKSNWVSVKNYEGLYEVSDKGQVRSLDRQVEQLNRYGDIIIRGYKGKILAPRKSTQNGYWYLHLSKQGRRKTFKIHRLVALHFIPNPYNKPEVNHLKTKEDNDIASLEWATSSENKKHAFATGLRVTDFGETSPAFKGVVVVFNKNNEEVDRLKGKRDIKSKGYTSCGVSSVLTGRQKTHRDCTFVLEENLNG